MTQTFSTARMQTERAEGNRAQDNVNIAAIYGPLVVADPLAAAAFLFIAEADKQKAPYPQYRGYFLNSDARTWTLVTVTRTIKTKMGVAFLAGDKALAMTGGTDRRATPKFVSVYSLRNRILTSIPAKAVR
jgi:hypothetical protein